MLRVNLKVEEKKELTKRGTAVIEGGLDTLDETMRDFNVWRDLFQWGTPAL